MKLISFLVLFLSLIIATFSLPAPLTISSPIPLRFDFHQDHFTFSNGSASASATSTKKDKTFFQWLASLVTPEKSISIDFQCTLKDVSQCEKAHNAYKSAANILSKVIRFKRPIKVKAVYSSFCDSQSECNSGTLGQATAPAYYILKDIDPDFWYPQALAKQITDKEYQWVEHDVYAQFNADNDVGLPKGINKFWFREDGKKIHPKQYDFEYVYVPFLVTKHRVSSFSCLHELLHGLGILSFWQVISPSSVKGLVVTGNKELEPALSPMLLLRDSATQPEKDEPLVSGVSLPFIFDKFIYESKTGGRIIDPFLKSYKSLTNYHAFHSKWVSYFVDNKAYDEGKRLYKLSTEKSSLVFRFPFKNRTEDVTLETTYSPFKSGSSLSHIDRERYLDTEEFLMRSEAEPGKTLAQLTPKDLFPIGDKTRKMLKAMGYNVAMDDLPAYGLGYNNAVRIVGAWSPIFVIILSCFW